MPETATKDRLRELETQVNAARDLKAEKAKTRDELREAFIASANDSDSDEYKAAMAAVDEFHEADEALQKCVETRSGVLKMLGQAGDSDRGADRGKSDDRDEDRVSPWSAKAMLADEDMREKLERAASTKGHVGGVTIGQLASREALKVDVTGTASMRRGDYVGIVPQQHRRIRLLDLMAIGTTDGNLVPYTQESGTYLAAETAESAAKPESGLVLTDVDAAVRTIAGWQKAPKQSLADFAALQSIIEERLRYDVQRRLEAQILAGNGTAPNLRGILSTAGIGTVAFAAATPFSDLILKGLVQVMNAEHEPNGIVLNPSDWERVLNVKATGSGEYLNGAMYGGPFGPNGPNLWGTTVVASTVIPAGTALVGDFLMGAQVFIREGVNVLMSDSDQDDFIRNRVTILAEMRAALAVWKPAAFSSVALV